MPIKYRKYKHSFLWSKWLTTSAIVQKKCPKCGAPEGFYCSMPSGRKKWPPHVERMSLIRVLEAGVGIGE